MISIFAPDRGHNVFTYSGIKVFFKNTNYYGSVHTYNYLLWMSFAREAFFSAVFPGLIISKELSNISIVTVQQEFDHISEAYFGDEISALIFSENVGKVSFCVVFEFYNVATNEILGVGRQKIAFLDKSTYRPTSMPLKLHSEIKLTERKMILDNKIDAVECKNIESDR